MADENGNGHRAATRLAELDRQIDSPAGLGEMVAIAFFCAACWLAVGLVVLATMMLSSGWQMPLLVAGALAVGTLIGLFPVVVYRREARIAGAALRAIEAEIPDQVLIDARAREAVVSARDHVHGG